MAAEVMRLSRAENNEDWCDLRETWFWQLVELSKDRVLIPDLQPCEDPWCIRDTEVLVFVCLLGLLCDERGFVGVCFCDKNFVVRILQIKNPVLWHASAWCHLQ